MYFIYLEDFYLIVIIEVEFDYFKHYMDFIVKSSFIKLDYVTKLKKIFFTEVSWLIIK